MPWGLKNNTSWSLELNRLKRCKSEKRKESWILIRFTQRHFIYYDKNIVGEKLTANIL